jgi:hypothetical protein
MRGESLIVASLCHPERNQKHPRKSEGAISLARARPFFRFFEDLARLPDHNAICDFSTVRSCKPKLTLSLPSVIATPYELSRVASCAFSFLIAREIPLPVPLDGPSSALFLEDFSSVGLNLIPDCSKN